MPFCTSCGAQMDEAARFCTSCGALVDRPGPSPEPEPEPVHSSRMKTRALSPPLLRNPSLFPLRNRSVRSGRSRSPRSLPRLLWSAGTTAPRGPVRAGKSAAILLRGAPPRRSPRRRVPFRPFHGRGFLDPVFVLHTRRRPDRRDHLGPRRLPQSKQAQSFQSVPFAVLIALVIAAIGYLLRGCSRTSFWAGSRMTSATSSGRC